ncbi:hypothetical protein COU96_00460, partial [Candidatus Shapirobacteria bacterium CG10_big_fil_rev_8_21_14_0_10_38_14]
KEISFNTKEKSLKKEYDFFTFKLEPGSTFYRDDPDKVKYRVHGKVPAKAVVEARVNFKRPGIFLPCNVMKIVDIENRKRGSLEVGLDYDWEIRSREISKYGDTIYLNRQTLRKMQRLAKEKKKSEFTQSSLDGFPRIPKDKK